MEVGDGARFNTVFADYREVTQGESVPWGRTVVSVKDRFPKSGVLFAIASRIFRRWQLRKWQADYGERSARAR